MKYLVALIALLLPLGAFASELCVLPATDVHYRSAGFANSGSVEVHVSSGPLGEVLGVEVTAFGEERKLPAKSIAQLKGFLCNGVMATFETGYPAEGAAYVVLVRAAIGSIYERAIITVRKGKALEIERVAR